MVDKKYEYEPVLDQVFYKLLEKLAHHDTIKEYRKLEHQIGEHDGLQRLVDDIKAHQKEMVRFDHYDKPNAYKEAKRLADEKQQQFDNHPLVIAYRESLVEANDLLQHVTNRLQKKVNDSLEKKLNQKEAGEK